MILFCVKDADSAAHKYTRNSVLHCGEIRRYCLPKEQYYCNVRAVATSEQTSHTDFGTNPVCNAIRECAPFLSQRLMVSRNFNSFQWTNC